MVSVTSASRFITSSPRYHPRYQSISSTYIRGLIPRNFAELSEAVPIALKCICKKIEPRIGPTICWASSGSHLFNALMINLKEVFLGKFSQDFLSIYILYFLQVQESIESSDKYEITSLVFPGNMYISRY